MGSARYMKKTGLVQLKNLMASIKYQKNEAQSLIETVSSVLAKLRYNDIYCEV